jgi:hypothetical protein
MEDEVRLVRGAELSRSAATRRPAQGVDHVRLAGAVRPDDGRHARRKLDADAVPEALETLKGQRR